MKKPQAGTLAAAVLIALAVGMALLALLLRLLPTGPDAGSRAGRQALLLSLGWEIDESSEEEKRVLIPSCDSGVMAAYNTLQKRQGYDLSRYTGRTVTQYSYRITNYPGYDGTVYATLYVSGRRVVGGDIHSAALGGFMHGLSRTEP